MTIMDYILIIAVSLTIGAFFGCIFSYPFYHWWSKALVIVATSLITCALITTLAATEKNLDVETWNGGMCPCGGEYALTSVTKWQNDETYYYTCDTCHSTIVTSCFFNKEVK